MNNLLAAPPQGTVTLLFSDIEGSTLRWEQFSDRFSEALQIHDRLIREAIAHHNGCEVKTVGDSFMVAFARAADAVRCAADIQAAFANAESAYPVWKTVNSIRVRIGLHTGEPTFRDNDYFGPAVNRASRIMDAGHGGLTLLSQETVRLAAEELGEPFRFEDRGLHRLKDLGQAERLFLLHHPDVPQPPFTTLRTLEALPHNFPAQVTSFVGREREWEELTELLRARLSRLITLTGPGGTGKTRLAMQVAADRLQDFPDGVWFVELAGIRDPIAVPSAIALALSLNLAPESDPKRQIMDFLRPRRCLLVLDNFEQVTDAALLVNDLLRECPLLTFLVTSRELLHISGEREYPVEPLSIPPPGKTDNHWTQYESVRLFVERCQAANPDFALTDESAPTVGEVCRRLDGIPLAIELAAARIRGMTPQQMLQRMARRFDLLASGQRDLPERQRTLRNAIDWSYDLLNEEERALFAEVAVFSGGFFIEAAEEVCLSPEALEGVFSLRDKSLLKTNEVNGQVRYLMLETLREYALEKLRATENLAELRDRHAAYYLRQAQELGEELDRGSAHANEARDSFALDIENMRSGMDWAAQQADWTRTAEYGKALANFLLGRYPYAECDARLTIAEEAARQSGDQKLLARLLNQHGRAALRCSDLERAHRCLSESYILSETLGDRARMLVPLINLGKIAWMHSDYPEARRLWEQGLELAVETRQTRFELLLRSNLSILACDQGDYEAAELHFDEVLAIRKRNNDEEGIAFTLYNSSSVYRHQRQYDTALDRLQESRRLFTTLGHKQGMALTGVFIGMNLLESGCPNEALPFVQEGLRIAQEIGDGHGEMYALDALGYIAGKNGDVTLACDQFRRSFAIAQAVGDRKHIADVLVHFSDSLREHDRLKDSYLLRAAAEREYAACGLPNADVTASREELGEAIGAETAASLDKIAASASPESLFRRL